MQGLFAGVVITAPVTKNFWTGISAVLFLLFLGFVPTRV
jgi:hypothetical protein